MKTRKNKPESTDCENGGGKWLRRENYANR